MAETNPGHINAALSNPRADMEALDALERTLFSLNYALGEIGGLGPVIDPPKATAQRGEAMAALQQMLVEAICDPAVGPLLERLEEQPELLGETRMAQVRVLRRDRASLVDVPAEEQAAFSRLTVEANDVWRRAKASNDWASFEPYLDRIVAAMRHMAACKNAEKDPYDVWLGEFEWGTDRAFYDRFFSQVKSCVVPLLADCVASRHKPSRSCVEGVFDEERQWRLAEDLARLEGLDEGALWIGRTEHPFTCGLSRDFVIVTGHAYADDVLSNTFSILHEGGHALYEQNVDEAYRMTSLASGTSMGMHEAQSRFFENLVGRSEAFAEPLLAVLRRHFPGQFGRVTAHQLYLAENCAEPGLIRTEADELTYPLHILVRYEIEQLLFSGEATASDVPRLWAEKYRSYLGVTVPDDAHGALQDTHWSDGSFGYFPTYALGSAFGAQFKAAMVAGGMDFDAVCASGDLTPVRDWLRDRIWRWGRAKDSAELVEAACGEPFSATYYTDYLTEKFSAIYRL
ncbi:carboxypeptidase M32 [Thermophilibacter mediterraneus]|uniref:carboxypeptidase M32 n=1 Tax=Thermophilibacter mediterraneus TaxID=1871031 RepID=UPI0009312BB4|nr:carboxypeptidase M32 [Thermophilibacter mediterraneus]